MTFGQAKTYCEGQGPGIFLATISDGFQQAFVETQVFKNNEESVYIGLLNDQVLLFAYRLMNLVVIRKPEIKTYKNKTKKL